jgi:hypothetical protein
MTLYLLATGAAKVNGAVLGQHFTGCTQITAHGVKRKAANRSSVLSSSSLLTSRHTTVNDCSRMDEVGGRSVPGRHYDRVIWSPLTLDPANVSLQCR